MVWLWKGASHGHHPLRRAQDIDELDRLIRTATNAKQHDRDHAIRLAIDGEMTVDIQHALGSSNASSACRTRSRGLYALLARLNLVVLAPRPSTHRATGRADARLGRTWLAAGCRPADRVQVGLRLRRGEPHERGELGPDHPDRQHRSDERASADDRRGSGRGHGGRVQWPGRPLYPAGESSWSAKTSKPSCTSRWEANGRLSNDCFARCLSRACRVPVPNRVEDAHPDAYARQTRFTASAGNGREGRFVRESGGSSQFRFFPRAERNRRSWPRPVYIKPSRGPRAAIQTIRNASLFSVGRFALRCRGRRDQRSRLFMQPESPCHSMRSVTQREGQDSGLSASD